MVGAEPWISIAIPSYNRSSLLQRAIDSVAAQTEGGWELWIVDDRSTDDTWEVAQAAAQDPRIHCEQNSTNLGLAGNFRYASQQGMAPYLLLLAADDFLEPAFLEKIHAVIKRDRELAMVCGRRVHFMAKTGRKRFYANSFEGRYESGQTAARALRNGNLYGLYSSVVVLRDALKNIGGIRKDNPWAGDYEAWVKIAARYPIYFEKNALVFQHIDSTTQTSRFLSSGMLVDYELKTLNRLLEDEAVNAAISLKDRDVAFYRISALWWGVKAYRMLYARHLEQPIRAQKPTIHMPVLATAVTLARLLWNRFRLSY